MMDAQALLADLHSRGFVLVPSTNGEKITIRPAELLTDDDRTVIRAYKPDLLRILSQNDEATCPPAPASPVAVEMIYVEPQPKVTPVDPRFPPCRKCGARRFWVTGSGKVVCGARGCGEVCYILASIKYHPIA